MNNNGHERITSTAQLANGPPENSEQARLTQPSVSENQNSLHEKVERLRLEVERLRDEQKALQLTPQSNHLHAGDKVEDHDSDDSDARDPA
ncbi:MAG: hypothetical protein WBE69_19565, partial [Candidatus Binataceae bacterium]